jgi:ABC-type transporter Mla subunit MlaD
VANQTAADTIGNVNEVLGSPQLNETVQQAAKNTTILSENLLENFNDAINSPEMKQETAEALNNIGDYTEIAVEALDKPLDKAIDELNEAGTKAASGAISGVIKVSTDAVAAVPYLGAVVELGKIVNDGSKAIGSVIEAGSETIETVSDLYTDTAKGIDKGIKELEKKKREAEDIRDRTEKSIQKFTQPINNISSIPGKSKVPTGGSKKTKKRLLGRKGKSKRVRFAL